MTKEHGHGQGEAEAPHHSHHGDEGACCAVVGAVAHFRIDSID